MIGETKENEALKSACSDAIEAIDKTNDDAFNYLRGVLIYCIGSYEYDLNPIGLFENAEKALNELTSYKEENPKKVTKAVLTKISKAITKYNKANA